MRGLLSLTGSLRRALPDDSEAAPADSGSDWLAWGEPVWSSESTPAALRAGDRMGEAASGKGREVVEGDCVLPTRLAFVPSSVACSSGTVSGGGACSERDGPASRRGDGG